MNMKVSILPVVFVVVLFAANCHSFPYWNYLFDDEETQAENEAAETEVTAEPSEVTEIPEVPEVPQVLEAPKVETTKAPKTPKAAKKPKVTKKPKVQEMKKMDVSSVTESSHESEENTIVALAKNSGVVRAPIGLFASIMKTGADSLRSVVKSGTGLGETTIDEANNLTNQAIDRTQEAIQTRTKSSANILSPWVSQLDTYRRSFSGSTKADANQAHSITVTTTSDAPITTMYGFMNEYMPSGGKSTGSSKLPPITSVDMSNFSYFG